MKRTLSIFFIWEFKITVFLHFAKVGVSAGKKLFTYDSSTILESKAPIRQPILLIGIRVSKRLIRVVASLPKRINKHFEFIVLVINVIDEQKRDCFFGDLVLSTLVLFL